MLSFIFGQPKPSAGSGAVAKKRMAYITKCNHTLSNKDRLLVNGRSIGLIRIRQDVTAVTFGNVPEYLTFDPASIDVAISESIYVDVKFRFEASSLLDH